MPLPDHLDVGPMMRARRRVPDEQYYGKLFSENPTKWLAIRARRRARNRALKDARQIAGDAAAQKRRGWPTEV